MRATRFLVVTVASAVLGAATVARARPSIDIRVAAEEPWTPTSVELRAGQRFRVQATGQARVLRLTPREWLFGFDFDRRVGPEGTYVWPRNYLKRSGRRPSVGFPLPAGHDGPQPAFCLIGRIGADGRPFYVGRSHDATADRDGRLWLGVNDYAFGDNRGGFVARISTDSPPPLAAEPRPLIEPSGAAGPAPDARVLLLYVDGLRPDVVEEMADAGFLPNIRSVFLDGGLQVVNALTVFPSNTLVANGALFTGLFPDRTGIKSQNQFERGVRKARGQAREWVTDWLLRRSSSTVRVSDLLDKFAPESTYRFLRSHGIKTLGSRLKHRYVYTILPIAPLSPPPRWPHRAINSIDNPFKAAIHIPAHLDEINANYLIDELLGDQDARIIAAWFPLVDKFSHHSARGQFGAARREVAVFDRLLGRIMTRLRQVGWERSTYLVLVSDHGHNGGETHVNRHCPLEDLFHRGLGFNVSVVGQRWTHPGLDPERFVFLDHQAWGQAAVYLPKRAYHAGPWQPNTLADLLRYDAGPNVGTVNLLERLAGFAGPGQPPGVEKPVDLVLVKLDDARVLVYRVEDNQAIIQTSAGHDGLERFRYTPAGHRDPLNYLRDAGVAKATGGSMSPGDWLAQPHTADEWLRATAESDYPDAVVGFARFFRWKPPLADLAAARDPDLLVTAARGWSFRTDGEPGTDHGGPWRESMRISLFLAGPRIRPGRLAEPYRITDVLPTMLEMAGVTYDPGEMDGRPIRGIYE